VSWLKSLTSAEEMLRTDLRTGWTVHAVGGDHSGLVPEIYPVEVPGCVHTDLMAAGVIPDPYLDGNEAALRWMYGVDWRYATVLDPGTVPLEPCGTGERVDLVFEGIDTIGTVRVGKGPEKIELGRTYNMHRSYRFDISSHVVGEPMEVEVDLASVTRYAEAERRRLGDRPSAYPTAPFNFIRKMACSFGWDWGPDLRTAGLWKPVRLERWTVARLAQVVPLVTLDSTGTGRVELGSSWSASIQKRN
jgi:beta-mannosidase